ncbi:MAG: hypothetical protein ACREBI_11535 [Nitrosotalea sp.]
MDKMRIILNMMSVPDKLMVIDENGAKEIARAFLEQYHGITKVAVIPDPPGDTGGGGRRTWRILVDTPHEQIEVLVNAKTGWIEGYAAKQRSDVESS